MDTKSEIEFLPLKTTIYGTEGRTLLPDADSLMCVHSYCRHMGQHQQSTQHHVQCCIPVGERWASWSS